MDTFLCTTWKFFHQLRVRPGLMASCIVGAVVFSLLPRQLALPTRSLPTRDIGGGLFLALAWIMITRATVAHMKQRARIQDDGAAVVPVLAAPAALARLAGIVLELGDIKALNPPGVLRL